MKEKNLLYEQSKTYKVIDINKQPKKCGCCNRLFNEIPTNSDFINQGDPFDGFYWNCACKSTLFYPVSRLKEAA